MIREILVWFRTGSNPANIFEAILKKKPAQNVVILTLYSKLIKEEKNDYKKLGNVF